MLESKWRRVPESNRCTRICNPLRHHSANSPLVVWGGAPAERAAGTVAAFGALIAGFEMLVQPSLSYEFAHFMHCACAMLGTVARSIRPKGGLVLPGWENCGKTAGTSTRPKSLVHD